MGCGGGWKRRAAQGTDGTIEGYTGPVILLALWLLSLLALIGCFVHRVKERTMQCEAAFLREKHPRKEGLVPPQESPRPQKNVSTATTVP